MNASEYNKAREAWGFNQSNIAPLLGVTIRMAQNYAADGVKNESVIRLIQALQHMPDRSRKAFIRNTLTSKES